MTKGVARRRPAAFPATVVEELARIESDLGGRREIVSMLVLAPLTPDLRYLLGLLGDPRAARLSLAELCVRGNVLPGALLKHLGDAALLAGKVRAARHIGQGIAAVAQDVMKRAAPFEAPCYACQGVGTLVPEPTPAQPNPSPERCDTCNGTGRLLYQPDLERQKLAIEMAQLLPKSGGIQIAQINASGGAGALGSGVGAMERISALTDRILYGAPQDAEILEVEDVSSAPQDDPPEAE